MREPARHRLLILLSDGRPNDVDEYEGRYGVEDMRQAVAEAAMQGVFPFCLAIDRQAAAWLPRVFREGRHARLVEPRELPRVLLEWMRRLVSA
jgi:nitric oxide reductase NorD protein